MYTKLINALSHTSEATPAHPLKITDSAETTPIIPLFDLYTKKAPAEPAVAQIWMDNEGLHLVVLMCDRFPHSRAKQGDHTWEMGDVCELFWQPDSAQKPYFEFHIAPNQVTLQYAIEDAEKLVANLYDESELKIETPMMAEATVFTEGTRSGWIATIDIPLNFVNISRMGAPQGRLAVCRYNEREDQSLELSSSVHFPSPRFHQPHCWHTFNYLPQL